MNKSNEIVFAPPIDWAKRKAKLLRKRIGTGWITHTVALDLLAKMYGFRNWSDYLDFKAGDLAFETGWDNELLETALDERRYLQSSTLMNELGLTEGDAFSVMIDVGISEKVFKWRMDGVDIAKGPEPEFLMFGDDNQQSTMSHTTNDRATQPIITYKRPRLISERTGPEES